jgi:hypothetical protein
MMVMCRLRVKDTYVVVSLCLSESLDLHTFRSVWYLDKCCGGGAHNSSSSSYFAILLIILAFFLYL